MIRASHYVLLRIMFTATPGESFAFWGEPKLRKRLRRKYEVIIISGIYGLCHFKGVFAIIMNRL